ncbi:MAG: chromosomal replication initiator protein DnaA [Prevotellaceae bacterium]|jgi:chromosomal replication initiator protein|nr:chromosomal replication initiator protein DnaA [Prevotellaceae bacterium]
MKSKVKLWENCLDIIHDNVSDEVFNAWFSPIIPLQYENKELVLQVPSMFFYEYIEEKFADLLRFTLNREFGSDTNLMYRVLVDKNSQTTTDMPTATPLPKNEKRREIPEVRSPFASVVQHDIDSQLNGNYTFDNFVEGKSNKLVRNAALNIAANPGKTIFNPLFIYGNSGVGKTHLAHAVGLETKRLHPDKRVLYVAANLFMVQYTNAVRQNSQNDFLNFYQSLDMLIIDDIQEFIERKGTQNTFFHIFNHLHQLGKQIVMICDRAPGDLDGMEQRLLTRFRWGLTTEIDKPDSTLRKAILQNKIYRNGLQNHISHEVIDFIAENANDTVRDLEGTLVSLLARSTINNEEINIPLVEKVIGITARAYKTITIDLICDVICERFALSRDLLNSRTRKREVAQPRQMAMYLSRKLTKNSLESIGYNIGNRDHATVMHACHLIEDLIEHDKIIKGDIAELVRKLKA